MFKKGLVTAVGAGSLLCPLMVSAGDLEDRVLELEAMAEESAEAIDTAPRVSGYVDSEYKMYRDKSGATPEFRIHHLSVFVEKKFDDKLKFFSEVEWEDGPEFEGATADGKIFLEAVNLDYTFNPMAHVRMGRFFTPAGIWSVDHYPPFVPTQERPAVIRKVFPAITDGLLVHGTVPVGSNFLNYDAYVGNGSGNTGHGDKDTHKAKGLKLDVVVPGANTNVGLTVYQDDADNELTGTGLHAKSRIASFTLQAEWAKGKMDAINAEKDGWYFQALYDINDWTYGVRVDTYDDGSKTKDTNSLIVNYHYSPSVVLKGEYHDIDDGGNTSGAAILSVAAFLGN